MLEFGLSSFNIKYFSTLQQFLMKQRGKSHIFGEVKEGVNQKFLRDVIQTNRLTQAKYMHPTKLRYIAGRYKV